MSDENPTENTGSEEAVEDYLQNRKTSEEVAKEVLSGHWSRGKRRAQFLRDAGYNVKNVNEEIDKIFNR